MSVSIPRDGHPKIDVEQRATYNFERSMTHVRRPPKWMRWPKWLPIWDCPMICREAAPLATHYCGNTVDRTASKQGRDLQSLVDELLPRIRVD